MPKIQRMPACLLMVCIVPTGPSADRLGLSLHVLSIEGKIVSIGESSITIAPALGAPREFRLQARTLVKIGQEVTNRSELGKGQQVRVLFDRRGWIAFSVTVLADVEPEEEPDAV